MTNIPISQLPVATTPLSWAELAPIDQGSVTKQTTVGAFSSAALNAISGLASAGTLTGTEPVPIIFGGVATKTTVANIANLNAVAGSAQTVTFSSLSAAAAATIPAGVSAIILTGYYAAGDQGGGLYARAGSGAGPGKFETADGAWWILTPGNGGVTPLQFGAKTDGVTDCTTAIQAALNFNPGTIFFPPYVFNYTTLTIGTNPVRLVGAMQSAGTSGGIPATILQSSDATTANKITVGGNLAQLNGVVFEHLVLNAPNTTGGAVVFFSNVGDSGMYDCQMLSLGGAARAVMGTQVNTVRFHDMRVVNPLTSGFYFYGTDTTRSDDIQFIGITVSGDSLGAGTHVPNALELDGFVNTINGHHCNFVQCGRGLYCHNTQGATQRAEFVMMYDMEVDFPLNECVRIDYHDACYFSDAYMHGSINGQNVQINTNSPSTTTNISFIGGNCTGAKLAGMYLNGNYTRIVGMIVTDNSLAGNGLYPGIEIGPNSEGVVVTGCNIGAEAGFVAATQSYGVLIDSGAVQYNVQGNNLLGNVTGALLDNALSVDTTGQSTTAFNLGQDNPQSQNITAALTGFSILVAGYQTLVLRPAGVLATGTITTPVAPYHGQRLNIQSSQNVTALTLTASAGQGIDTASAITSLTANVGVAFVWNANAALWYRII